MLETADELKKTSEATFSNGFLHRDTLMLIDQQKIVSISSVLTLDTVKKT